MTSIGQCKMKNKLENSMDFNNVLSEFLKNIYTGISIKTEVPDLGEDSTAM